MEAIKVSVVVPVYNVDEFLDNTYPYIMSNHI